MPYCRFNFLCLVVILCISLCAGIGSSRVKMCIEIEKQALLKLKDGFINGRKILSSWNGEDCCEWEGVSCNNLTGYVTGLDLQKGNTNNSLLLGGKLDSSICEVQHLTSLNLYFNNLQGKIPKCIGSLGQLVELNLSLNNFVTHIPPSLGNLSNLQTLDLGWNNLVANDLEWLSQLSNLRYLDFSSMNLGQAENWLSSITKIPSLSELYLDHCGLYQAIPKFIPHINSSKSLKTLSLSFNELNSSSISWVFNVSKVLTHLDLSENSLSTIPAGFSSLISLQQLDLSYNELEGSIPKPIESLCRLKELQMSSNKLTGQLSENILQLCCAKKNLEWLDLSNNPFSNGPLPDFSWISTLKTLSLRNTNIVGPLPHSFGHLPYLSYLDLSFNQLSGPFSLFEVTEVASLEELDLSHNQLKGALPYNIGQLSKLRRLFLSSNKLDGVIREAHLSNLSSLQVLDVAGNSLSFNLSSKWVPPFQLKDLFASSCNLGPKFPTWLKYQKNLYTLDVSNCGIRGSFPNWFWDLSSSLSYLNVSHNILSGALPKSLPSMNSLLNINWDFSFNSLSGSLPPFPEVDALFLSNNMFSGSLSSFCETSNYLTYLDLSYNLLEGTLLDCWEKFQNLRVLNLANNYLSGTIPKSVGFLRQIESIHLSNNNFFGEIPSLTLCSSLAFIDFGDNNLQGTLSTWMVHNLTQLTVLRLQSNQLQGIIPTSLCDMSFLQVLDLSRNNITGKIPQCLNNIDALSNISFPRKDIGYLTGESIFGHEYEFGSSANKAIFAWKGANREYGKNLRYLTSIDLSNNHLIGVIPKSIAKLVALASLNVSRNHLTGFIPNNIGQMKNLESLDLSGNNLSGRMPLSISNLTFLSTMNLSFNKFYGKIPTSTQLQSLDPSTYIGNNGLCGPPLTNHCSGDVISPTGSPEKHATNEDEDEDGLITLGFYVSLVLGFFVGFWGVCGTLVIKRSWRIAYFQFFSNMNDWVHVTLAVSKARLKRRLHIQE